MISTQITKNPPRTKMTNIKCSTKRCRNEADLIVCGVPYCDMHNRKRLEQKEGEIYGSGLGILAGAVQDPEQVSGR